MLIYVRNKFCELLKSVQNFLVAMRNPKVQIQFEEKIRVKKNMKKKLLHTRMDFTWTLVCVTAGGTGTFKT